jgi:hypothetical protein
LSGFLQRALALGSAALLAGVLALALSDRGSGGSGSTLPQPAVGLGAGWLKVSVGVADAVGRRGRRTPCGWLIVRGTLGIVHPVLPCGAKLFVSYRGTEALTRVVDRGPVPQGRAFDLTPALAKKLRVKGVRELQWAFAQAG